MSAVGQKIDFEIPLVTEEQIRGAYGHYFVDLVGIQNLQSMPRVAAESLNLQNPAKYPNHILPGHLKGHSAVKGIDGANRPFIAIQVKACDSLTGKTYRYVELIFKRYSLNGDGGVNGLHPNYYVAPHSYTCSDGASRSSSFYSGANSDWNPLKNLLDDEAVTTVLMPQNWFITKV